MSGGADGTGARGPIDRWLRWTPAGIGLALVLVTIGFFLTTEAFVVRDLLAVGLPLGTGIVLTAYGGWLVQEEATITRVKQVVLFLSVAVVLGLFLDLWFVNLIALEAQPTGEPGVLLLNSVGVTLAGVLPMAHFYTALHQRRRELNREKERLDNLASIISHDLRNPLNVARGYVEMAATDNEFRNFEEVQRSFDRMEHIIDDSLTIAQVEASPDLQTVSLRAVTEEAWSMVPDRDGASIQIGADLRMRANRDRLQTLLENAFRNAVEHGGDGVAVEVGVLEDEVGFYIADDGTGIPGDQRERVFEAGYSSDADGTGLGLSIVRTVADAHNWSHRLDESASGGVRLEFRDVERP